MFDLDGVRVPRLFVSSRGGEGLPALREQLAALAQAAAAQHMTPGTAAEFERVPV